MILVLTTSLILGASQGDLIRLRAIEYSRTMGVDPALTWAVIHVESRWRPDAVSPSGAVGLMQLMPDTAKELGVDPHDWDQNLRGGVMYLAWLLKVFSWDESLAVAAYNCGVGRVKRRGRVPRIDETIRYVKRVLTFRQTLAKHGLCRMIKGKKRCYVLASRLEVQSQPTANDSGESTSQSSANIRQ